MECLGSETVALYVAGGLSPGLRVRADAHVDRCPACRTWIARAARMATGDGITATTPTIATPVLPARGTAIGRYIVESVVGRGAMGVVLRAHDPVLDRAVALKLLHRASDSAAAYAAVLDEARSLARLSDPHVVQVFDVETWCGRLVLAMELVLGTSLRRAAERASRPELVRMLLAAAQGLSAAHAAGIVHRDFKPDNVLVADDGRVLVGDFGLAQPSDVDRTQDTSSGAAEDLVVGTPAYMAPEQRAGRSVDARADQYAFCVTAVELLLGARPKALADDPGLAVALKGLPRPLARALERGLAESPAARAPTMAPLIDALERASSRSLAGIVPAGFISLGWLVPVAALGTLALATTWAIRVADEVASADAAIDSAPQVTPAVQLLLDRSIVHDRANDPHGMLAVLDEAVAQAEASGDQAGLALSWAARGSQLGKIGRDSEAIEQLEQSFHLATRIDRADIAADAAVIRVGFLAESPGRIDEAITWGRHAEATLSRMDVLDVRLQAEFDQAMGRTHLLRGELESAQHRLLRAVEALRRESPRLDRHLHKNLILLAHTETALGHPVLARRHLQEALEVSILVHGPEHADVGAVMANLAKVDADLGDDAGAIHLLERARPLIAGAYGEHDENVLKIDASLAALGMRSGRLHETIEMLQRVLVDAPAEFPVTCGLHERLAVSLARVDRKEESEARFGRALECYAALFGPDSPQSKRAREALASIQDGAVRAP